MRTEFAAANNGGEGSIIMVAPSQRNISHWRNGRNFTKRS